MPFLPPLLALVEEPLFLYYLAILVTPSVVSIIREEGNFGGKMTRELIWYSITQRN